MKEGKNVLQVKIEVAVDVTPALKQIGELRKVLDAVEEALQQVAEGAPEVN